MEVQDVAGARSPCSRCSFTCSSSVPPAPCTIAFGGPVVPDENMTNSGWSNGRRGQAGRVAVALGGQPAQPVAPRARAHRQGLVVQDEQPPHRRQPVEQPVEQSLAGHLGAVDDQQDRLDLLQPADQRRRRPCRA